MTLSKYVHLFSIFSPFIWPEAGIRIHAGRFNVSVAWSKEWEWFSVMSFATRGDRWRWFIHVAFWLIDINKSD